LDIFSERVRAFRGVDLNLFIVFVSIYEQGSLTAAGRALGITQSAVSHSLARLRDTLDDPLFLRKGTSVVPTPFARGIVTDVYQALDLLRYGPLGENIFDPSKSTASFRIATSASLEIFLLPRLLKALSKQAPNIAVSMERVAQDQIENELARGELSFALDTKLPDKTQFKWRAVRSDDLITVSSRSNPSTSHGLDKNTYVEGTHILITPDKTGSGLEDMVLAEHNLKRHIIARCGTITSAIRSVAETNHLLTLGRGQLAAIEPNHDLAVFEFPFSSKKSEGYIVWHEIVDDDPAHLWLLELISGIITED